MSLESLHPLFDPFLPASEVAPLFEGVNAPPSDLLDVVLDAAEMGVWRYRLDDHVCVYSPRSQQLYGLDRSRFVHDADGVQKLLHPDDVGTMRRAVQRACDPEGDGRYRVEYRVRRPEGGWRWLSVCGLAQFEDNGTGRRAVSIIGASRDITEDKRADVFLEAQKRSLELVVNGAPLREILTYITQVVERQSEGQALASILLLDQQGCLRNGASPSLPADYLAAIDGLKAGEDLGTCSIAAVTGRVVLTPDIAGDPYWAPIKHLPLDLGLRAAWSQPIVARDGRVLGTFGTYFRECREPTASERQAVEILSHTAALAIERARADETLREADRRKDEFIATLSHELRNPLAPLRTAVHLLRSGHADQVGPGRLLDMMERQVTQLVRLVDDLLEVSRISRGAVELHCEPVDVASVVRMAVETSEPVLHEARHRLTLQLPDEPIVVNGDRVRMAQILSNLLNNAAKYTEPGGHVIVRVGVEGAQVSVAVRDNGVGIDPDHVPQLFELFVRGTGSGGRHREGLGIGLALARTLAEMHGGTLEGTSEGPGRGSEFTLRLPRVSSPSNAAQNTILAGPGERQIHSRVLVVDDNGDAAEMTALLLRDLGCQVAVAADGGTALAAAERLRPDLVLLDIGLPDMSGHDVCARLRQLPWGADAQIVALSGWGQASDLERSANVGFDRHLVKPVDPPELIELLSPRLGKAPTNGS